MTFDINLANLWHWSKNKENSHETAPRPCMISKGGNAGWKCHGGKQYTGYGMKTPWRDVKYYESVYLRAGCVMLAGRGTLTMKVIA